MKKVLILSNVWCEPNSSAAGTHMAQIISFLAEQDYFITYASTANPSGYKKDFSTINFIEKQIALNDSTIEDWIKTLNPNTIIYDRFMVEEQFGWRLRELCPFALHILNTEDLHSLRKSRQEAIKLNVDFSITFWKTQESALREISSIYRCDATLLVSKVEIELLAKEFSIPEFLLHYLPIQASKKEFDNCSFEQRAHFVCIGNYMHEPNLDCLKFVKKELWEGIRKQLPKVEFHSYGAYPNSKSNALHDPKNGFHVLGRVEDIEQCLRKYKVCLAPLRFGAGIKGKFIDAMQNGLPSITTKIGAEAMGDSENWPGFVTDNSTELIQLSVKLYQEKLLWQEKQKLGFLLLSDTYSGKDEYSDFAKLLSIQSESILDIRKNNFLGLLLKHQSNNSTKYFSKWIEAKNKQS